MKKHVTAKQSILVFTQVFPNSAQPGLGLFVRERMLRVGNVRPIVVVAPVPWFPMQSLIRYWHPDFRAEPPRKEIDSGIEVFHPRFLSVPGGLKWLDGLSMALFSLPTLLAARKQYDFKLIDSHFAFPDGYAASILGDWLKIPVTITLRGTEIPLSDFVFRRACMVKAINSAVRIFTVANSLKDHMIKMGARNDHILRVGNGVDVERFHPEDKAEARRRLKIAEDAKVLIGAGGLCERKGFHRVIKVLPKLMERHKDLVYLIVGGGGPEGDWSERLQKQTINLGLLAAFEMSPIKLDRFIGTIRAFRPAMLFGYPSSLALIARHARNKGIVMDDLGVKVAFITSEQLYEDQRSDIARIFGCRVANGYGGRDAGFIAHECPEGGMHITGEDIVVEIVDQEGNGLPAGKAGEIVVTHLATRDFPFIRYRTGDVGMLSDRVCACGRELPMLGDIQGRTTDFVVAGDGTIMHGLALIYVVRDVPGISKFKIVQESIEHTRVFLVPDSRFEPESIQMIKRGFIDRLGSGVRVDVETVDHIPAESSGKFRYIVSKEKIR